MEGSAQVTRLLVALSEGDRGALDRLLPLVYSELRRMAHHQRYANRAGETLSTTALVHEAYLKLVNREEASWQNRSHFFCVAARAMRQILVDYARSRYTAKRGGNRVQVPLEEYMLLSDDRAEEVLALDEALRALEQMDERQGRIVELRYFTGFSIPETAEALGISEATVKREWTAARAWLFREIQKDA